MLDRSFPECAAGNTRHVAIPSPLPAWRRGEIILKWMAVALGASIPVSVVLDNVLLGILLFFWLAGGAYRDKLAAIRGNPVAWLALALWALFLVGSLYSIGTRQDVLQGLAKSLRLLLVPALIYLLREPLWRKRAIAAFLASMLVTLVLSWLLWLGLVPGNGWIKGSPLEPVVFKAHITHNVFMAFAAFLLAQAALEAKSPRVRIALGLACAAAAANVLLMVPGRTGMLVLVVLFVYCLLARAQGPRVRARRHRAGGACRVRPGHTGQHDAQADHARRPGVYAVARRRRARAHFFRGACDSNSWRTRWRSSVAIP